MTELACLRPQLRREGPAATYDSTPEERTDDLRGIYKFVDSFSQQRWCGQSGHGPLSALCLSGGGIRSATFNLGVIQTLARIGLLESSTICPAFRAVATSHPGCVPGCTAGEWPKSSASSARGAKGSDPLNIEPKPVVNLREYSNYLTPASACSPATRGRPPPRLLAICFSTGSSWCRSSPPSSAFPCCLC